MDLVNILLNSVVIVATVLGSWMAFPQARRLARTRRVEGVSPAWIGVSLAINCSQHIGGPIRGSNAIIVNKR